MENSPQMQEFGCAPISGEFRESVRDETPKKAVHYVAVANIELGRALAATPPKPTEKWHETSKARIYIVRELFIKALGEQGNPSGFAANEHDQCQKFGVTTWEFRQARQLAKRALGNFDRSQSRYKAGVVYAAERRLADPSKGAVRLPVEFVRTESAKVIAFAAATLLSPKPQRPVDVGKKIGFKDERTCNRLARDVAETGVIELHKGRKGALWVGRLGIDFDAISAGADAVVTSLASDQPGEFLPGEFLPAIFPPTQISCKEGTLTGNVTIPHHTTDAGRRSGTRVTKVLLKNWREPANDGANSWRAMQDFQRDCFTLPTPKELEAAPYSAWIADVERAGPVPDHLSSSFAHAQAIDMARELQSIYYWDTDTPGPVQPLFGNLVRAVAGLISRENAAGATILSFSYLYSRIYSMVGQQDESWLYDLPSKLPPETISQRRVEAEKLLAYARQCGHRLDHLELTSTVALEQLNNILHELGDGDGFLYMCRGIAATERLEDRDWIRWAGFRNQAIAARNRSEAAKRGARNRGFQHGY